MNFRLFQKNITSPTAWGICKDDNVSTSISIDLCITRTSLFHFIASCGNVSCCYRNPFKALIAVLEAQAVGMAKYCELKDHLRNKSMWRKL